MDEGRDDVVSCSNRTSALPSAWLIGAVVLLTTVATTAIGVVQPGGVIHACASAKANNGDFADRDSAR